MFVSQVFQVLFGVLLAEFDEGKFLAARGD
jgi:hypothetical protein